ncbi:MAG: AraC family transcriptional regulator [Cellulosilyticaceae bacterium]
MFYEHKSLAIQGMLSYSLAFPTHLHHHVELVYMLEGSSKAFVESQSYDLHAGDIFITFPNQIHQYQKVDEEKSIVLIFPPDICPEYKTIFMGYLPHSPLIKSNSTSKNLLSFFENIITQNDCPSSHSKLILKGYFLILLGKLFEMLDLQPVTSERTDILKEILIYCSHHYMNDLKLQDLERDLHISRYRISHLLNQKLHISFNDYINMLRISYACNIILSDDIKITSIAYLVGFNNPRSFNRAFLKYTGLTPRDYRSTHILGP